MIAMALSCDPDVLIADEPTTALDVTIQAQIIDLMNEMQQRLGSAIVMITHDLGVVAETCKNVLVMYAGNHGGVRNGRADLLSSEASVHDGSARVVAAFRRDRILRASIPIEGQPPNLLRLPPGCSFAPRCAYKMPACDAPVPLYDFGERPRRALLSLRREDGGRTASSGRVGARGGPRYGDRAERSATA